MQKKYFDEDGYVSIWLCNTKSEEMLRQYVEIDYEDEEDEIGFQMGHDFNIWWYDEDFFEASHKKNAKGWDLLDGHSYMENIKCILKEKYSHLLDKEYNGIIIFYNFKYDGNIAEKENNQYGYFKFVGSFEYQM